MCGIALIAGGDRARLSRAIASMTACQAHRGPNDEGVELFPLGPDGGGGAVALGHRRLSILDLSPLGHQPMIHPATGDALVFNGEIYNFAEIRSQLEQRGASFRGHSDTEVLLHALAAWGDDTLRRLAGMFSLAYFQRRTNRLLLARDPFGIKPLYVADTGEYLLAGSELRAMLCSGLVEHRVSRAGLASALAYGAVQDPYTMFEQVRAFPAGCFQWIDLLPSGDRSPGPIQRHWSFPKVDERMTEQAARDRLDFELTRAVREHMIADVPVGIFLSSGIDSTLMAGLARQLSNQVRTFTLGFLDQPDLSESNLARESARTLGVEHHDIQITGDLALGRTIKWVETLDQPSFDGLNTYIISNAVRDAGMVVAISGLGADELFGGYPLMTDVPRFYRLLARMRSFSPGLRRMALSAMAVGRDKTIREKMLDMGEVGADMARLHLHRRRANSTDVMQSFGLVAGELAMAETYQAMDVMTELRVDEDNPIGSVCRLDSRFCMGNMLLRDSDATSMQHSLEIRVPYLDRRVADFAFSVPDRVMLPLAVPNKHLLRLTFSRFLRPDVLAQGKKGFTLPIRRWMVTSLRDLCEQSLRQLKDSGLVRPEAVDATWRQFLADPEARIWSRAFLLCVVGQYLEHSARWSPATATTRTSPVTVS
jgi:asparagine synthase (glutamine-hydrolysing)